MQCPQVSSAKTLESGELIVYFSPGKSPNTYFNLINGWKENLFDHVKSGTLIIQRVRHFKQE